MCLVVATSPIVADSGRCREGFPVLVSYSSDGPPEGRGT